mgnify:CR=1 FL=1
MMAPVYAFVQIAIYTQFKGKTFGPVSDDFGTIKALGMTLFTEYYYPFEIISILLLVALVGVVALAKRRLA